MPRSARRGVTGVDAVLSLGSGSMAELAVTVAVLTEAFGLATTAVTVSVATAPLVSVPTVQSPVPLL